MPPEPRVTSSPPHADTSAAMAVPPLVLVRGNEQLLVDRAISRVVAAARRADPATERRDAAASGLSVGQWNDLVAPSLFAEPRVVIVRGAHEAAKDLAAAISSLVSSPVDGVTVVVHHGGGVRNKKLIDDLVRAGASVVVCDKITRPGERRDFVRGEIKAANGNCSAAAVEALVDAVGTDLAELASAANQLVADTNGMVDEAAVRRYHRGRADVSGFAVADQVVAGNIAGALEALRWALLLGEHPVKIADALASGMRSMAKVAASKASGSAQIAAQWGIPPWKVDRLRGAAKAWPAAGIELALTTMARLNADVKGGAVDEAYALERAVLTLGRARHMRSATVV